MSSSVTVNVTPVTDSPLTVVVRMIVSLSSSTLSFTIVTVPVAEVWPTAIVNAEGSE